jgi:hypothetical protein
MKKIMINFDSLKTYADYKAITGPDLVEFMSTKSRAEIDEFKTFCATPKTMTKEDGTTTTRQPNFFEMRNWVLDKYYPGLTESQKAKSEGHKLIDEIMAL